jgi:GR25 family glycosyltransferase involved in LPS biosynthesis
MDVAFGIIIPVYNRVDSLNRLLQTLQKATFKEKCDLVFSIEKNTRNEVLSLIKAFNWTQGSLRFEQNKYQKGPDGNNINCFELGSKYEYFCILEDDVIVHPQFFEYVLDCTKFYQKAADIAGFSLYRYYLDEQKGIPHVVLYNSSFTFFLQKPCSRGAFYTGVQASRFLDYYTHEYTPSTKHMPEKVLGWGNENWERIFQQYLLETSMTIVYPFFSFATMYGEIGVHVKYSHNLLSYQSVLIGRYDQTKLVFSSLKSGVHYNQFFKLDESKYNYADFKDKSDLGLLPQESSRVTFNGIQLSEEQVRTLSLASKYRNSRVGWFDVVHTMSYRELFILFLKKLKRSFISLYTISRSHFEKGWK